MLHKGQLQMVQILECLTSWYFSSSSRENETGFIVRQNQTAQTLKPFLQSPATVSLPTVRDLIVHVSPGYNRRLSLVKMKKMGKFSI